MYKRKGNPSSENPNPSKKPSSQSSSIAGTEPWKLVFNDARRAFSENKFKEAVALFTRALTLNPNHVTLLDCRAASYEKLNELDLALRDAASIVKIAPTDSRGYLRASKLFSLQKKFNKAISLYTSALKKVDPKDTRFALINTMKQNAEKAARPPSKRDPLAILPHDVISIIFSHLSFDRRIQCSGVSQRWRNFTLNWSGMWRDLEFSNRKVSHTLIKKYLKYAQGRHVRSFSVHYANRNAMKNILQSLIDENCQYVETLDFKGCDIPINLFARMLRLVGKHAKHVRLDQTNINATELLEEIIPLCPQLTHLSVLRLLEGPEYTKSEHPQLEKLEYLRCNTHGTKIIQLSQHLISLDMYSNTVNFLNFYEAIVSSHRELEVLNFSYGDSKEKTQWIPANTTTLEVARVGGGLRAFGLYDDSSFKTQHVQPFFTKNPDVENLSILNCDQSIGVGLADYVKNYGLPRLTQLNLPRCASLTELDLHAIITKCPLLEEVLIPMTICVDDSIMNDFGTTTKKLKVLDISDCNNFTGVGLQVLVRAHQTHLEKLVLNNCQRIGPDAVKWVTDQLGRRVVECKYRVK